MSNSSNKKSSIELNYSSNSFIQSGDNSPLNSNGSVNFYTSIHQANKDYTCRHTLNYSTLIPQLQLDIFELGNKWNNIIIEIDRVPFKRRIVSEIMHKSDKYKFYIVPYISSIPQQPIICNDLVTMLSTIKDLIESKIKRFDYIIIANCTYSGELYNGNGLIVV